MLQIFVVVQYVPLPISPAFPSFLKKTNVNHRNIKIMVRNAADNTIRGSYRPMRILQFYFNAQQKGNSPTQFNEEVIIIIIATLISQ